MSKSSLNLHTSFPSKITDGNMHMEPIQRSSSLSIERYEDESDSSDGEFAGLHPNSEYVNSITKRVNQKEKKSFRTRVISAFTETDPKKKEEKRSGPSVTSLVSKIEESISSAATLVDPVPGTVTVTAASKPSDIPLVLVEKHTPIASPVNATPILSAYTASKTHEPIVKQVSVPNVQTKTVRTSNGIKNIPIPVTNKTKKSVQRETVATSSKAVQVRTQVAPLSHNMIAKQSSVNTFIKFMNKTTMKSFSVAQSTIELIDVMNVQYIDVLKSIIMAIIEIIGNGMHNIPGLIRVFTRTRELYGKPVVQVQRSVQEIALLVKDLTLVLIMNNLITLQRPGDRTEFKQILENVSAELELSGEFISSYSWLFTN